MSVYMTQATSNLINMSSEELKELLNDESKLEERIKNATSSLESDKEQLLNENRQLAEGNLEKEPELIEKRGRINELSVEGVQLCSEVTIKLDEIKNKSGDLTADTALALLQTAAAESEEESEKLVRSFLDKDLPVDGFLEKFMEMRKQMHTRKFKADKMQELIRNPRPDPSVPYPMMGMMGMPGMPMPGMFPSY